jgi:hypothetical protein
MARLSDPPPPRSPFLLPPPRPQLPPPSPALQQRAWAALALAVLSLLAITLISNIARGAYVVGVALAVAAVGLVLAFGSMSAAKRAGTRRPRGVIAATILGLIGFLFSGILLIGFLAFGSEIDQYSNCMKAANTTATQAACENQLNNYFSREIKLMGGN